MGTSRQTSVPPSAPGGAATATAQARHPHGRDPGPTPDHGSGSMLGSAVVAALVAAIVIGMAWTYSVLFGGFDYSAVGIDEAQITGAINLAFSSKHTYTSGNLVPIVRRYSQFQERDFTPDGMAIFSPFRTRITVIGSGKATYAVEWHSLPSGACRFLLDSFYGPRGVQPSAISVNGVKIALPLTSAIGGKACDRLTGNDVKLVF